MQGQEIYELKLEEEAIQCVDFIDESLHKSDSNENNMDDDDDDFLQSAKAISTQSMFRNVTGYIASAVFWLRKDCNYENFHCDKCYICLQTLICKAW
jgi:hypothetical protein